MAQFGLSFEYQMAKRRSVKRSGFTLVEIAVALAIFVIGALAIIQIFPPALNVVRGSERRTAATQMSRARVVAYEDRAQVAPDAIYTTVGGNWTDFRSSITNDALMQTGGITTATLPRGPGEASLPATDANNITQTTLGNFKRVQGEKHKVRSRYIATATPPEQIYVLTEFPYDAPGVRVYVDETIKNVRIHPDGYLDFSNAYRASSGTLIRDTSQPAALPAYAIPPIEAFRSEAVFYVTYRWMQQVGASTQKRVQGVIDEPVRMVEDDATFTAAYNRVVINDTDGDGNGDVIPGTVTVRARVRLLATPILGSTNDQRTGVVNLSGVNLQGFDEVSLDYDVSDWRNMVWDEVATRAANPPPGGAPVANQVVINTPMLNLDPELPITTLFQRPPTGTETEPVLEWSTWLDGTVTSTGTDHILNGPDGANPSAGRVTFELLDTTPADPPPLTPTRTVFRTLDNWAHQFTVAAASYVPFPGTAAPAIHPREGWREYYRSSAGAARLYFQASEAGKLVMVDYEYVDATAPGGFRQVQGAILPISSELENQTVANFAPNSQRVSFVTLTNLNGNLLGATQVSAVTAVRGVSIAARTAWLENGRYRQVVTKGYRPLVSAL
ncbi:MAG TPA: prepilin-type N-terminal cleavage/methylation domain-containing protein [Abditibacteriaceae bacterium]|jgi:prepilin-type N-terminal cleavage/methylation domain-containing protein